MCAYLLRPFPDQRIMSDLELKKEKRFCCHYVNHKGHKGKAKMSASSSTAKSNVWIFDSLFDTFHFWRSEKLAKTWSWMNQEEVTIGVQQPCQQEKHARLHDDPGTPGLQIRWSFDSLPGSHRGVPSFLCQTCSVYIYITPLWAEEFLFVSLLNV